jgi:hypothetical protein
MRPVGCNEAGICQHSEQVLVPATTHMHVQLHSRAEHDRASCTHPCCKLLCRGSSTHRLRAVHVPRRYVFQTEAGTPFIFSGTGTGGWESALTNTLSPGATEALPSVKATTAITAACNLNCGSMQGASHHSMPEQHVAVLQCYCSGTAPGCLPSI